MDKEKEIEEMTAEIQYAMDVVQEKNKSTIAAEALAWYLVERKDYRKADEVRKESAGEIERLKAALDDAIHSFTRMETLYKIKCFNSETETAKKIFTEWYHDVKAMGEDAEYIKEKAWKEYGVEVDE